MAILSDSRHAAAIEDEQAGRPEPGQDHRHLAEAAARRHELTRAKAIQALRELDRAGQRATEASLRARLAAALQRNQQLTDENARLRRQLAHALGAARRPR